MHSPEHQEPFTGEVLSLGFGTELAGTTLAGDWQKYFDPYDWQKETALGEQYQTELGGLFEQAGAGTMNLMSSWAGGGQTLSGRKGRARKALGKEAAYGAFKLGQGLDVSRLSERTAWEREQRSNLNTLLGMDIFEGGNGNGDGGCPLATCPDGSCEDNIDDCSDLLPPGQVSGCTNSNATNYNPNATVDDGSCEYGGPPPPNECFEPTPYDCYGTCVGSAFECGE